MSVSQQISFFNSTFYFNLIINKGLGQTRVKFSNLGLGQVSLFKPNPCAGLGDVSCIGR